MSVFYARKAADRLAPASVQVGLFTSIEGAMTSCEGDARRAGRSLSVWSPGVPLSADESVHRATRSDGCTYWVIRGRSALRRA